MTITHFTDGYELMMAIIAIIAYWYELIGAVITIITYYGSDTSKV